MESEAGPQEAKKLDFLIIPHGFRFGPNVIGPNGSNDGGEDPL